MLDLFTGITVLCTARKCWNGELFRRVDDVLYRVTGHNAHVGVESNTYHRDLIGANRGEYVVKFDVCCDVSSDVRRERKRCNLLIKLIKGIVDEKLCVEVCLNGTELLVVSDND